MNMNDYDRLSNVGKRIRKCIELHGEKISDVANDMNISADHLRCLLRDQYKWTEDKVLFFARRYDLSLDTLYLGGEIENDRLIDALYQINEGIDCVMELSKKDQKASVMHMNKRINEIINLW